MRTFLLDSDSTFRPAGGRSTGPKRISTSYELGVRDWCTLLGPGASRKHESITRRRAVDAPPRHVGHASTGIMEVDCRGTGIYEHATMIPATALVRTNRESVRWSGTFTLSRRAIQASSEGSSCRQTVRDTTGNPPAAGLGSEHRVSHRSLSRAATLHPGRRRRIA